MQDFYEAMLQDPTLGQFFERVDIIQLVQHQAVFLSMVMGGPKHYSSGEIAGAHVTLGISHDQFETSIGHLATALRRSGFREADINEIVDNYRQYEPHVTASRL